MLARANDNHPPGPCAYGVKVFTDPAMLYELELLRQKTGDKTRGIALARALREFSEGCGVRFFGVEADLDQLHKAGLIQPEDEVAGFLPCTVAWLPWPLVASLESILCRRTRSDDFVEVMEKVLRWARRRYRY